MENDATVIKEKLADYYDQASREYHHVNYQLIGNYSPLKYRQYYIERMIENLPLPKGARILDVGCGPGELSLSLLRKGFDLRAVDISKGMVDEAIRTLQGNGFPGSNLVSVGDIEMLAFDDEFFDLVVASGVIEYQKGDERALSEMTRVLRYPGYLILNVTNRYSYTTLFESPYRYLKRVTLIKNLLNFLKNRLLRKGPLNYFPDRRTHSPRRFDETLTRYGFEKLDHNYFHFSPLPVPLNSLFSFVCDPIGHHMEKLTKTNFGNLGGGYLVLAKKMIAVPNGNPPAATE